MREFWQKKPGERYKSCQNFIKVLQQVLDDFEKKQVCQYLSEAKVLIEAHAYKEAEKKLRALQLIHTTSESLELLNKCVHRSEIMINTKQLLNEMEKIRKAEPWIMELLQKEKFEFKRRNLNILKNIAVEKIENDHYIEPGIHFPITSQNPAGIDWVDIPAGEFLFGVKMKKRSISDSFRIGKFPITNAQYKKFIDANPKYKVPRSWNKRKRNFQENKANHPVVNINWHDAQAFCEWANCRLPKEDEWEKAARGTDGRIFPWGEKIEKSTCENLVQELNQEITSVDKFPNNASPYGVMDLCGNVWEWVTCNNNNDRYVLRGGSSINSVFTVKSASLLRYFPASYLYNFGFRCVVLR